jgi:aminoglycoside phosphotransferase (APT) family kinase protein
LTDLCSARLLEAAVFALRQEILPRVSDESARLKIDHVTRLLWAVSARLSKREDGLRAYLASAGAWLGTRASAAGASDIAVLEQQRVETEAVISARLPTLLKGGAADLEKLRGLLEVERTFYVSQDADVAKGSAVVYTGGRIAAATAAKDSAAAEITADSLTQYIGQRFGRSNLSVTEVARVPGGFSKDTIFFTLMDAEKESPQKLVIRKDLPVPLLGKTVINEYTRIERLFSRGFPVAEPVWLENDTQLFGGAFLVSRRVDGSSDVRRWGTDSARAKAGCLRLAAILATLHSVPPTSAGFAASDAGLSAGESMEREIDYWMRLFQTRRTEAFPLQELPLLWLAENVPSELYQRPSCFVHGDVGFHNLMMDDTGKVTALLDWEFSGLGDPTQDLCFVRQFVEPLMPWPQFLDAYGQAGGAAPCAEAEFFYKLWTKTRNAVGCVDSQTLFDQKLPTEMRFALSGHVFAPYMFVDQCETLIEHLALPYK